MQFELTTNILDSLILAIEEKNSAFLHKQLHDLYPQDIAIIINQLNLDQAAYLYEILDDDVAPIVLLELDDDKREELLATFSSKEIAEQIDNMDSDDAADVISELPKKIQYISK